MVILWHRCEEPFEKPLWCWSNINILSYCQGQYFCNYSRVEANVLFLAALEHIVQCSRYQRGEKYKDVTLEWNPKRSAFSHVLHS